MRSKENSSATVLETPAPQRTERSADQNPFPAGAVISGKVLCRTRRESKSKDGTTRYMISLSILAQQGVFVVQRWADQAVPEDLPVVSQEVQLPVRIDAYLQAGVPKVRLVWADAQFADSF
jgi:hypothetical protein